MIQYSLQPAHHPDWAWQTPEGFRDEPSVLPFVFTDILADGKSKFLGLPVQCDDDADFHVRALLCPQLGITPAGSAVGTSGSESTPGRIRISTGNEQQLSRDLVLYGGVWCAAGWSNLYAAGGSLVDPVVIPAGGALLVDLQLATTGQPSTALQSSGSSTLLFYYNVFGTAGDGHTLTLLDPGAPNSPLSGSAAAGDGTVSLATDGGGALITTLAELADFINVTADLAALFVGSLSGDGSELAAADVLTFDNGGPGGVVSVAGAFVGVKRFKLAC